MGLNAFEWILIGFLAFSTFSSVAIAGKPREPLTNGQVIVIILIQTAIIIGLIINAN